LVREKRRKGKITSVQSVLPHEKGKVERTNLVWKSLPLLLSILIWNKWKKKRKEKKGPPKRKNSN